MTSKYCDSFESQVLRIFARLYCLASTTSRQPKHPEMDSEVQRDGRVLDLTDDAWREDRLPYEDVTIPLSELPEAEQDNGGSTESVKEQEMKWSDLALQSLHENTPNTGT
ncbi:anaphase-promoting complex subunit 13 isoform X1 [Oncorhynchus tshawytscha]|nr:anaphase-promoting complex subunit 13 isoform X1 [Oncorhynchus kisutch]XP_021479465.1 anaphase-promoting complex subunit 13 isoform X1 [Oncorhynchus mykiss]XP_042182858.1 anaphase-promoting complex subunit 13 isoform X1 [Oncorhynchus tshawytscha]CDQ59860.1 unnamed protein product [Oncorhynchus mykiss]